ncbi:MAG: tol-pal system protein YbgF [Pseudomonadota bacterium]
MRLLLAALMISLGLSLQASAQVVDPRILQLEEQLRQLNGRIEELNFQMLQMQETLRRQQEDNEFRLQQLEEEQQGSIEATPNPGAPATDLAAVGNDVPAVDGDALPPKQDRVVPLLQSPNQGQGEPPRSLGSLTIGSDGAVTGATVDFSDSNIATAIDNGAVASIGGARNAEELYEMGYKHVLEGDYALAESIFKSLIDIYPNDPLAPDAHFWLGESMLAQGRFEDAGAVFVELRSLYPNASKAPETMLKIGTIMAALGNRDVACATFADALSTQPGMSQAVRARIDQEYTSARC